MKKKKKSSKKHHPLICKNCKLYDAKNGICKVVVLHGGEKFELMTEPNDRCKWEEMGIPVSRVRAWSDGNNGYVEYDADDLLK